MGWSNHKLTKPFTKIALNGQGDLQLALHSSKMTQIELFANGVVALFAKYKAFKSNNVFLDSYGDTNSARKTALIAANYGVAIPTNTSLGDPSSQNSFWYKLLNSQMMWYYDRPTAYLRAMDFENYIDDPEPLMLPNAITSYRLLSDGSMEIQWPEPIGAPFRDEQLQREEIMINGVAMTDYYFGALVYYSSSQYTWIATNKVSQVLGVTLANMGAYAGKTVTIVPFLSSLPLAQSTGPSAPVVLASYNLAPITATISAHTGNWDIMPGTSQWNDAFTQINYEIMVRNNTSAQRTMQFYISIGDDPATQTPIDTDVQLVTVNANSQMTLTGTFNYSRVGTEMIYIFASGNYNGEVVPTEIYQILEPLTPPEP